MLGGLFVYCDKNLKKKKRRILPLCFILPTTPCPLNVIEGQQIENMTCLYTKPSYNFQIPTSLPPFTLPFCSTVKDFINKSAG